MADVPVARRPAPTVAPVGAADGDAGLMAQVCRGDEQAFARLYDRLAPTVVGVARRVLRNPAQADEVAQEVFVELWRTARTFDRDRASVGAWAAMIAHRRAVDRVRSESSRQRRDERVGLLDPVVGADPAGDVIDDFDRRRVGRALGSLTELQRQVVELAYYGGHTHTEIADLLDVPLGTVKTRVRDGLIRLRDALGDHP